MYLSCYDLAIYSIIIDLNLYIALISLSLTLISGLLIKNKKVIINLLLDLISLGGIKLVYLIKKILNWKVYLQIYVIIERSKVGSL